YGDLAKQAVQRFSSYEDLKSQNTTIEEREEYEPHIEAGTVVYAGVDYERILRAAEKEADIVLWDGGNNDFSFIRPDFSIVVADPHRAGHEMRYHPGEANLRMADVIIINKVDSARKGDVAAVERNAKAVNPKAKIILAKSAVTIDDASLAKGKTVLVVGDGPTLTHGGMAFGAGSIAAKKYNCRVVDGRKYAKGSLKAVYARYPNISELPAMGYGKKQAAELEATINAVPCDAVLDASPVDLSRLLKINKPVVRVRYELAEDAVRALKSMLGKYGF
ncbi:MAG TPA: GTP-binding protein, partial [archaeon]|nr:GTP-binding protein [archaeon]